MKLRTALFSVVLIAAIGGGGVYGTQWWAERQHVVTTDNAYIRGNVTVISPQIDGEVTEVHVAHNQPVQAGDILVSFSPASFESRVDTARADVKAALAEIEVGRAAVDNMRARRNLQRSLIAQAEARVAAVKAEAVLAGQELARYTALMERDSTTRQKFEGAAAADQMKRAEVLRAEAELMGARDQLPVIDSEIRRLETEVERLAAMAARAKSKLDQAEIALSDTIVYAPSDGIIANRKVEPGMYMEAGWPMMSLVPLENIWVEANFKETRLKGVRVGQTAYLHVDTFPDRPVMGRVESLSPASAAEFSLLPSQNANGNFIKVVQRIPVRITFDVPPALKGRLVPGMSVVVKIDTRAKPENTPISANAAE